MTRFIFSVLVMLVLMSALPGCAAKKRAYSEKKGLMLLENTQLGRNKGYYSKHKAKTLDRSYQKILKKRKYTK